MFSYSRISLYNQCPKKYQYRYIDKLPTKSYAHLKKGTNVHTILENIENLIEYSNNDEYKEAYPIAVNFYNSDLGKDILQRDDTKSVREFEFFLDYNLYPTDKKENALFIGYIDRINIDYKNKCIDIIDYKTGKYKELKYQDFTQLIIYAVYFLQRYNIIDEVKLRFVYVEHLRENTLILNRNAIENHKQLLKENIVRILKSTQNNDFKCNRTKLCDWCDFQEYCNKENEGWAS